MTFNRGGYSVYIDGVLKGSYSAYTPETRWQAVKTWGSLSNDDHTIEVVANGSGYVDIDSFVVDTPYIWSGYCNISDGEQHQPNGLTLFPTISRVNTGTCSTSRKERLLCHGIL